MAETYESYLDIKVGMKAISNMLNKDDNRTFAHELGHSGGLKHRMDVGNLMTQKRIIQKKKEIISRRLSWIIPKYEPFGITISITS